MLATMNYAETPELQLREGTLQRKYGKKYRPHSRGIIGELLFAHELIQPLKDEKPADWRQRTSTVGAAQYHYGDQEYLAMDWGRWFDYRYATTGTFFREDWLGALTRPKNKALPTLEERREVLSRKMRVTYAPGENTVLALPGDVPPPERLAKAWGVPSFLVDIIPLEVLEIKSYREVAREKGWTGIERRTHQAMTARKQKKRRAHHPLYFQLQLFSVGSKTRLTSLRGFHLGRTIYFQIPGRYGREMFLAKGGPKHLQNQQALPKGVLVQDKVYSFSAKYIAQHLSQFPSVSPEHKDQIVSFSQNTRTEVVRYIKQHSHKVVSGCPSKFTEAQDAAIITYYRPKMPPSDSSAMWAACTGFTPAEVARRAKVLRNKLIWEDGITECENLPHQRRTEGLLRELRNAIMAKKRPKKKEKR
jgi:hypothetical protein